MIPIDFDIRQMIDRMLFGMPDWAVRLSLAGITLLLIYLIRRWLLSQIERLVRSALQRLNPTHANAIVDTLLLPMQFLIIALALVISGQILTPDAETRLFVNNLVRSIVIVTGFVSLFRIVDTFALDTRRLAIVIGFNMEDRLLPLLRTTVKVVLFLMAIVIVMGEWSIDVSGLIASLGIVGLAFSLAAQDTVANLFGFSMIVGDQPFLVGEFIRAGDIEGVVENVGVRSTRIRKPDRSLITVPNSILASSPVERFLRRRIQFTLGVTYSTTADQMETLLGQIRSMLHQREHVVKNSIAVYFTNFGDSSLDIMVLYEVTIRDWRMLLEEREQVNLAVMRIVAALDLGIAFPTRSIYIDGLPKGWQGSASPDSL